MKLSKAKRREERKAKEIRNKEKDNFIYALIIAFAAGSVVLHICKPVSIGHDIKYTFFIELFPIALGIVLFIIYRNKLLHTSAILKLKLYQKAGAAVTLLLVVSLLSYLTFGLLFRLGFEYANYTSAQNNKPSIITLPVAKFAQGTGRHRRSTNYIYFSFLNKKEKINVSLEDIKQLKSEASVKNRIELKLRQGIWNHYIVEEWDIVK